MDTVPIDNLKAQLAILRHCKEKRAELADMEANARAAIETALGEAENGTIDGHIAVTYKTVKRTAIDQKLLKQRHPDIAAECLTVSESRRFELARGDQ